MNENTLPLRNKLAAQLWENLKTRIRAHYFERPSLKEWDYIVNLTEGGNGKNVSQ